MSVLLFFVAVLYLAMPLYLANMAPVLVKWIPWGSGPIDGGRLYRGEPVFGPHKTWRGLLAGTLVGLAAVWLQKQLLAVAFFRGISWLPYDAVSWPALGLAMGLGALLGDLVKSFAKRRCGRAEGSPWPPFDQIDFLVGGFVGASLFVSLPIWPVFATILLTIPLHRLSNEIAFRLHLKDVPW